MHDPEDVSTLERRLKEIERRADEDRAQIKSLRERLLPKPKSSRKATPNQATPKQPSGWEVALDIFLWLVGTLGVFAYIVGEMHWHWVVALLIAPIGGFVVWALGRAGVTI